MIRVADYIISFIYDKLKVNDIFMISGGGIMHLTDAIGCHGKIRYVCSHNEQATSMEADGYAKLRGDFGVALVTSGPGATNAISGVVGAWQDSSPIIVLSGQNKIKQTVYSTGLNNLRQFGVQEANVLPLVTPCTKFAVMIDDARKIRYYLEKAVFLAKRGRPGPVWLDIPLDIQGALIDPDGLQGFDLKKEGYVESFDTIEMEKNIKQVIQDIEGSKRPIIIAGQGVRIAKAVKSFNVLVEQLNIPVVTPRLGIDLMDSGHPLFVGRPGIKGDRAANFAVQNADYILAIGTRLSINLVGHEYEKFAREAKVVVVDIDETEHKKPTIKIDRFIKMDARFFIENMAGYVLEMKIKKENDWPKRCRRWKMNYPVVLEEYRKQKSPINTYYFTEVLSSLLTPEDIIVIDSGSSSYVVSQSIKIKYGQRYLASGGLGAMGYALPAAIGASVAAGKKMAICITGDGSLHMNIQELQTVVHEGLPLKLFIFNNHGYASIKTTQHNFFNDRFVGVDEKSGVSLPDPLKIAELYSIKGIRIRDVDKMESEIKKVLEYDGPVICAIECSADQLIIPTVYSIKKENGTMVSRPLEDMYPFLDREVFKKEMIVKPMED